VDVQSDGSYKLGDGRILSAQEVASLHTTAPMSQKAVVRKEQKEQNTVELREGQCSGPIRLLD
jgi:hypothetical protein